MISLVTGVSIAMYCILFYSVDGASNAPAYQGETLSDHIANPGFEPLPSFNPHPMMYRHQQQQPNGWSYSFGHPSPITLADFVSGRQLSEVDEEQDAKQVGLNQDVSASTKATPACGLGPTTFPATRAMISERLAGGTDAKKNAWPFMVS